MRNLFFGVLFIFLSAYSNAQAKEYLKDYSAMKKFAESVMEKAGSGDFLGALNTMVPYTIVPEAEVQGVIYQSKAQRDQYGVRYGKSIGHEFIAEKKAGKSLLLLTFIEKTAMHALPWEFYFYKTEKGWVLNSFQWHDNISVLFQ